MLTMDAMIISVSVTQQMTIKIFFHFIFEFKLLKISQHAAIKMAINSICMIGFLTQDERMTTINVAKIDKMLFYLLLT